MNIKEDVEKCSNNVHEDVSIPLLQEQKIFSNETSKKSSPWMVYLSTVVVVCGSFEFGSCVGFSSPTQAAITKDLSLTLEEYSVFGSILTSGAMIGAIMSGQISDFIGRKGAMRTATGFCVAGWLAIYFAKVPVYIAEIAPKNLRGTLTAVHQLMICTGVSVSFIIGTVLAWRTLALAGKFDMSIYSNYMTQAGLISSAIAGLIPCAIMLVGLLFIPESPRWLAKIGHEKEFESELKNLRVKDADISKEVAEIQDYIETLERIPKAKMLDLFQRRYLRPVVIGVGLMVFQQFGGINGICFYVSNIFESAGVSSSTGTIVYAILQLPITVLCTYVIDKAGRKPLLLVSSTGLVIACILSGISFYLKDHNLALNSAPILALAGILIYISSFSAGMGAVPWVIMSEARSSDLTYFIFLEVSEFYRSSWKPSNTGELVWCMGSFLLLQLPYAGALLVPSCFMLQYMRWVYCLWSEWFLKQREKPWNKFKQKSMHRENEAVDSSVEHIARKNMIPSLVDESRLCDQSVIIGLVDHCWVTLIADDRSQLALLAWGGHAVV
ncbi:Sugar transporter ERD6-like 16 [Hibiscus syriacus]|uniref:Sugar transporter ERD6-like 16 n=1 Tax=Hibiscus syriacus TaxID=106335 RepID=A0A6A2YBP5_HIBSY|nr:Sugar transporter ERD6-like 16 [Hibiscus syriacus]